MNRGSSGGGKAAERCRTPGRFARVRRAGIAWFRLHLVPLVFAVWSGLAVSSGNAAAPVLEHLYPAGMNPGTTNLVSAVGKFDPWPAEAFVEGGGVRFLARTNSGKFDVSVDAGAAPGIRLVRFYGGDGASEPRLFVVGSGSDVSEAEPNDRVAAAQHLQTLPAVVNGRLDRNGDVDSFVVPVRAGQWLEAAVDAFTLMSKVDAVLRVVNTNGQVLAWNHDHATFDPRIIRRSEVDEIVVVQVYGFRYPADSSVSLAGGEGAIYRLRLSAAGACPKTLPEGPAETEPNDGLKEAGPLPSSGVVLGRIGSGEDVDRYRVHAVKDGYLRIDVEAGRWGSPLDSWVRVEDMEGKELAFNDDGENTRDARLEWKAPRDGSFVVAVGSRTHRGGDAYAYALRVARAEPEIRARVLSSSVLVESGKTNDLKVSLTRRWGATNALRVVVRDLPEGVIASAPEAPAGDGEVVVKLSTEGTRTNAFNGPVRVVLEDRGNGTEHPVPFDLVSRGENNGVPQGWSTLLREQTDRVWLTVKPGK